MTPPVAFWELAGAGAAVGGAGVWALAAAARVGALRLLLDLFPRATWDAVTWGLIPMLLFVPCAAQGALVAWLAGPRPGSAWRAVLWSACGTLVALGVFGAALLYGVRRLPPHTIAVVAKTAPNVLIATFAFALLAGWLLVVARCTRWWRLRAFAVPIAAVAVGLAEWRAHGHLVALSYVLDRTEAEGFFAAVAVGGALGAAWGVCRPFARRSASGEEAA
ncbi:MAG TPA: hypothetical protein VKZ50_12025 [bacterium]|nr:hypothetical protein [bacterium]